MISFLQTWFQRGKIWAFNIPNTHIHILYSLPLRESPKGNKKLQAIHYNTMLITIAWASRRWTDRYLKIID